MRYSQCYKSLVTQFNAPKGHQTAFLLLSPPGGGKTAVAKAAQAGIIAGSTGAPIPPERRLITWPSIMDTCDYLGMPDLSGDSTRWVPPAQLYQIRKGTGPATIILDELTDASVQVQNVLCSLILERRVGDLELTDELYIICTGNRTEDKSGANRLTTKLGNRLRILHFDTNLDDWVEGFAIPEGLPVDLIQFLRYKPNLLHDFNPNTPTNPTPRSWAKVATVPESLDPECYLANVAGEVGEGPAAEYVGFKRIYQNLPDLDVVLKDPAKAPVSKDPAVMYAIAGALAAKSTPTNFERVLQYMDRLPAEFSVLCVKDAIVREKKLRTTAPFRAWTMKHSDVLF